MEHAYVVVTVEEARGRLAARLLPGVGPSRLGEIELAPHQLAAARRIATLLAAHGGALLADEVGLGKTFVASAVARAYHDVLVIAPAALAGMWRAALARSGIAAAIVSYEALSRGGVTALHPDLVILDEAHHARSASAKRHPRITALTSAAHTLLLTATPVPNRLEELRTLFTLFLGQRAHSLDDAELSALIVRRTAASVPRVLLPPVRAPRWIEVADDTACLQALEQLPPPVPPAGGGDGGVLLLIGLVRQWASSRAALIAGLRRRLAHAHALASALGAGHFPTRRELDAWQLLDDTMQLALPELAATPAARDADVQALSCAVRRHGDAVAALLAQVRTTPDPDVERASRITELRRTHRGERIVCFTAHAQTASGYWRHLRHQPHVARLTALGGEIASGRLSREEVLQRFAPAGQRCQAVRDVEDITLLIATDLLSEGVDLRDATVVVHLDLPWSPARMEQRVGRARRLGSEARAITVYAMRPPAAADRLIDVETRLRRKVAVAGRSVGAAGLVLPPLVTAGDTGAGPGDPSCTDGGPASDTERMSRLVDRIARWSGGHESTVSRHAGACGAWNSPATATSDDTVAAFAEAPRSGWLALLRAGRQCRLLAQIDDVTGSDVAQLERAVELAGRGTGACTAGMIGRAYGAASRCAAEWAASLSVGAHGEAAIIQRRVLARIRSAYAGAPPHRRTHMAALADSARRVATQRLTSGVERELAALCEAIDDDEAWLAAVASLAADAGVAVVPGARVDVLIVFGPRLAGTPPPYSDFSSFSDAELTQ